MSEYKRMEQDGALGGKYLTFDLAEEEYGMKILMVREIIGLMVITPIPRTEHYVMGVINLRGKVIPVIDLRIKLGMEAAEVTEETCVIVVDMDDTEIGVIVDRVSEVLDIPAGSIEDTPSFGAGVNTDFILGMGKREDKVTILLDIEKILMHSILEGSVAHAGRGEEQSAESPPRL